MRIVKTKPTLQPTVTTKTTTTTTKPKVEPKKEVKPKTPTPVLTTTSTVTTTPSSTPPTPKKIVKSPKAPPPSTDKNVAKIELKIGNWGEKTKSPCVNSEDRLISIKPKKEEPEVVTKEPEAKKRKVEKTEQKVKFEKKIETSTIKSPATTPRQVEEVVEEKKEQSVVIVQQGEIRNRSGSKTRILLLSPVNQSRVRKR